MEKIDVGPAAGKNAFALSLPSGAAALIARLEAAGWEAYAVGGCVRDSLLGRPVHDWDLCTAAAPGQVRACCADLPVLDTGLRHGTVTVLWEHEPYEITTFRQDGAYSGHRRPVQVAFVGSLAEDLARRDFTINAMAYSARTGLVDLYGGRDDLWARRLRCVGDPLRRLEEDALRILRALRFAAQLGFCIEPATAAALRARSELLRFVSAERVYAELTRLLCGPAAGPVLEEYGGVLCAVLPEIAPCMGFAQETPYHDRDVWGHTARAVGAAPTDADVRWALLLHDLGKPACFARGADGRGHFYGHGARSEALAEQILARLRAENARKETVLPLVALHDSPLAPTAKSARRWLARLGPAQLQRLIAVQRADTAAHAQSCPAVQARPAQLDAFAAQVQAARAQGACFTRHRLAVNGRDLLELGVPAGPAVGRALDALLARVVDGELPNTPSALRAAVRAGNFSGENMEEYVE